jgi:hypothetical protein
MAGPVCRPPANAIAAHKPLIDLVVGLIVQKELRAKQYEIAVWYRRIS